MKRGAIALPLVLASALHASRALADPCVTIAPGADVLDDRARARLTEQLAASLAQHGIGTCGAGETSLADVAFDAQGHGDVAISVRVRDAATNKEVTRVVDLRRTPRDGRALALAVAADELLRASWAEVLLTRAPDPPAEPPPVVRAIVEASTAPKDAPSAPVAPSPARTFFLGASIAGEHATGGLSLGGIDARFGAWLAPRLGLAFRVGARVAPSSTAPDGEATGSALLAGAGVLVALLPRERAFTLDVPLRVDVSRVTIFAHPAAGARGADASAFDATASTGLLAGLHLGATWSLDLEATIGAVLHPVDANDGTSTFTSLSGAQVGAALGVRALL